ncbi:MAG: ydeK [Rhodocyclaceae bacterium]|nr:MAG: ydeK [Rhodocyclaceae bacterium]TND04612.1 MAG: ydeK [Rhodocyclaceae bacterium]
MRFLSSKPWLNGLVGVLIFSGSLPATRLALQDFEPLFLTYARASIAGLAGILCLWAARQSWPRRDDVAGLCLTALGVVVGFPLLTALALQQMSAARGLLYIALLPVATAVFAVVRAAERPRPAFWLFSCVASGLVMGFALSVGPIEGSWAGDAAMFAAITVCGLGYAEGGRLSRHLGGWQVICWALLLALPVMLPLAWAAWPERWEATSGASIAALLYVGLFSMLIGFIFWYRGLADGGIASIGQLQFLQPFLGLMLSAAILGERISPDLIVVMVLVVSCVAGTRRFARA